MLHTDLNSLKRRFIGTKEIAYINKPAEIIVIDRIDKCLYPVTALQPFASTGRYFSKPVFENLSASGPIVAS